MIDKGDAGGPAALRIDIDRDSRVPPYQQLAAALRKQIETGRIQPGRRIPSLVELEQATGLARDTIRKGIAVLKDEGLVETELGLGVFVVEKPSD